MHRAKYLCTFLRRRKITRREYAIFFNHLYKENKIKMPHIVKIKVLFLQENALAHTSMKAMAKLQELKNKFLHHLSYFAVLFPATFINFLTSTCGSRGKTAKLMRSMEPHRNYSKSKASSCYRTLQ